MGRPYNIVGDPPPARQLAVAPPPGKARVPQEFLGRGQGKWTPAAAYGLETQWSLAARGCPCHNRDLGSAYLFFEPEHRPERAGLGARI